MSISVDQLRAEILAGCEAGDIVIIPRQTFWAVKWPGKEPLAQEMGNFLASLRCQCITHSISFEGYHFTKAGF